MKKVEFLKWLEAATDGLDNPEIKFFREAGNFKPEELEFKGGEAESDFISGSDDKLNIRLGKLDK